MSGDAGSVSIPQAIAFKDKVFETPGRPANSESDITAAASESTYSVSPLRSEPFYSTTEDTIEEHVLVKTIREQIQKEPNKSDPPAWTKHLNSNPGSSVEKTNPKESEKRDDGSKASNSTQENIMVARDQSQAPSASSAKSEVLQIAAIADKARAEIAELEAILAQQENEALALAEQAAAIVALLEAETDKKAKMAEVAILKAKLALQGVGNGMKSDGDIAANIAKTIAEAEKETLVTEDRAEIASFSSTRDERQEHSVSSPSNNAEVSAITEQVIDIADPPAIVRQIELPAVVQEKRSKKDLTVVTDMDDTINEFVVSPLGDGSPRKRTIDEDGSTIDTIYKKIEECRETILNPNASMEEQSKAAELMEKMARIAKITGELEPKKPVISPLSCPASTNGIPREIATLEEKSKGNAPL